MAILTRINDAKPNGGHEWIHSETIDPHRHIYDEEWVCESGDLQMRIYHSIPCDDGEFWLAEIHNYHRKENYGTCSVMVDDFDAAPAKPCGELKLFEEDYA